MRPSVFESIAGGVAAAVLAASLVVVATRDESGTKSAVPLSAGTPSPSATTNGGHARTPAKPRATAAPRATPPPSTLGPGPSARPAAPLKAKAVGRPPKPGKYDYAETDSEGTTTSTTEIASQGGGNQTEKSEDGNVVDEVVWGAEAKRHRVTTFSGPNGNVRCDWEPDVTEYEFPMRPGASWRVNSRCHPNASTTIAISATSRVLREETEAVAGRRVATWVIVSDGKLTFTFGGSSFSQTVHDEDHFAPEFGLTVREIVSSTGVGPSGEQTSEKSTRVLKNLEPHS